MPLSRGKGTILYFFGGAGELLSQEHVIVLLIFYGCRAVVPRVNGGVAGQGEEFLSYRADEVLVVGVGEIGAANASAKKRVAG